MKLLLFGMEHALEAEAAEAARRDRCEARRERLQAEKHWPVHVADSTGLQPKDVKATVEGIFRLAAEQMKNWGSFKLKGMLKLRAYKAKCPKHTIIRFRIWRVGPRVVFFNRQPMAIKAAPMKKLTEMVQRKDEFRFVNWV